MTVVLIGRQHCNGCLSAYIQVNVVSNSIGLDSGWVVMGYSNSAQMKSLASSFQFNQVPVSIK